MVIVGYSIITNRNVYAALFKAICLSGAFIAGQMEWHWHHTITRKLFYPDDYIESPKYECLVSKLASNGHLPEVFMGERTADMLPAFVWVMRNGTLEAGDILCYIESNKVSSSSRKMVANKFFSTGKKSDETHIKNATSLGVITSAKPHALHSKHCSIAIIHSRLFIQQAGNNQLKKRLWAYSPRRGVLIPVVVKPGEGAK